ncbi:MAG: 16S rRNA (uracil(1498)-N(3))-methyltransferase [Alphaproteobacteria bacterium]|nr:16S rRNA (uracil(1498)-N(3))-methyltransferase [Alphaproteobacteria bacterium]
MSYPGGLLRLFLEPALSEGRQVTPSEAQDHYLRHVMRAKEGDAVRLFNGRDGEWRARIEAMTRRAICLRVEDRLRPQRQEPDLWLLCAPIKRTGIDFIVEKAAELGASRIKPVFTARTIVTRVNHQRLLAHAIEAAEQSERLTVPVIDPAVTLSAALQQWDPTRRLIFCDEGGGAPEIGAALRAASPQPAAILSGPEGGFTPAERELLHGKTYVLPVTLGPRILRADTAALAALALWQSICGDWYEPLR